MLHNFSGQSIQTSMQNLESLAQKMAELPLEAPDKKKYHNLLGQSIGTSMQNLDSVAELPLYAKETSPF